MSKRIKKDNREIKAARMAKRQEGESYYVFVVNDRTGSTKLVNRDKAYDIIHGKYGALGIRERNLKDTYTLKEI